MTERPLIAVLIGGTSSRMGTDKALVPVAGRPMASWVVDTARTIGDVVVVGRVEELLGAATVPDAIPGGRGPAAGLATALSMADGRPVVLLAVDQPWIRRSTVMHLLARFDGVTPVLPLDDGVRQVTCAVYPPSAGAAMAGAAAAERSIHSVLDEGCETIAPAAWATWGEDGRSWFSVDTPEALAIGLDRFGSPAED